MSSLRALRWLDGLRDARAPVRYAAGLTMGLTALGMTAALDFGLHRPSSSPLFAATLLIAWSAGLGPALVTAAIGVVAVDQLAEAAVPAWSMSSGAVLWMLVLGTTILGMSWVAAAIRRMDDEREHLLEREHTARTEAEAANRAKDDFLAVVSHELRSPLTAMLGWLTVLRRGDLGPAEAARALTTIERNTKLQARLIDDLLDASRAAHGTFDVELRPLNFSGAVAAAVDILRPSADAAGVLLVHQLPPDLPVDGDDRRLQQVVINLVANAIKFTPRGRCVRLAAQRDGDHVCLSVTDAGIGIEPNVLPHVFERFYRGARHGPHGVSGLGLGLAIVKHIVERHAGSIGVHSAGRGACFTVTLPLKRPAPGGPDLIGVRPSPAGLCQPRKPVVAESLGPGRLDVREEAPDRDVLRQAPQPDRDTSRSHT